MAHSNPKASLQNTWKRTPDLDPSVGVDDFQQEAQNPAASQRTGFPLRQTRQTVYQPAEVGAGVFFERVSRDPFDISYACLLIPRFSSHLLIGDVAEALREWLPDICISFSWRLEHIFVRPEYLQWILTVPAITTPSRCIHTVRLNTSKRIFEDFPQYKRENVSKDFWAPGYLVIVGATPHPQELVDQHIQLTRQQQGIQPRRNP